MTTLILYLLLHFALVGGLLLAVPRVGRRGLLFGVYVGEEGFQSDAARRITRGWTIGTSVGLAVGLAACVLLAAAGSKLPLLVAPWFVLLAFTVAYVTAHRRARALAAPAPRTSVAALDGGRPETLLPLLTLVLGVAASVYAAIYTAQHYDSLPERIPIHFDLRGEPDGWADKSPLAVFLLPFLTCVMSVGLGVLCFAVARAKRVLRVSGGTASARAQSRFRAAMTLFVCATAWATVGIMTSLSIGAIDAALDPDGGLSHSVSLFTGGLFLVVAIGVPALFLLGQGGARLEGAAASAPLSDALADDRHWKLGLVYYNREDPSFLVEHRFGIGYTLNFGNRWAVGFLIAFVALVLGAGIAATWI